MDSGWRFKDGFRPRRGADATIVGEVILRLRAARKLTPSAYIEEARPKGSAIHETLTWDNVAAASEYRLIEARRIIRSTEYVEVRPATDDNPECVTVVENIHVPDREKRGEGQYVSSQDVADDADEYAAALAEARARFASAWTAFRRLQRVSEGKSEASTVLSIAAEGFAAVDRALGMVA